MADQQEEVEATLSVDPKVLWEWVRDEALKDTTFLKALANSPFFQQALTSAPIFGNNAGAIGAAAAGASVAAAITR